MSLQRIRYQAICTKYFVTSIWYQVLGAKYSIPSTVASLGVKQLVPNNWFQDFGTKYLAAFVVVEPDSPDDSMEIVD